MLCGSHMRDQLLAFTHNYDSLHSVAIILIYIQIGCALLGSLGALYNGVCLINLGIALFALVAIESSSHTLGRTYAFLLFSAIFLDISWFILFTHQISNISSKDYSALFIFSVKLTLAMQIVGFVVRLSSSLLWIQIYRLGASGSEDLDIRNGFLSPAPVTPTSSLLGGSVYDQLYCSSMFEDGHENKHSYGMCNHDSVANDSTSATQASHKSYVGRSLQALDEENGPNKMGLV